MIPLAEPTLDGNEARYLAECIESGFVSSTGPFVGRFEREFADGVGSRYAVACSSGTAALHVALRLAGAGPGALVAVSDFTFIASANAVSYTGAALLLVDSDCDSWNMNTELLYDEVTRRAVRGKPIPDLVEVVHVLGHPADLEPLLRLRDEYGVTIVEDAAEALGATWTHGPLAGRQVGTVGQLGCFSFNGNKIITSGGGGMIVTDDGDLALRAKHLTTQAKVNGGEYFHDTIGYNYRLSNLAAAVGTAQLEHLPERLRAKRAIARRYATRLAGLPLTVAPRASWADPSHWLTSALVDDGVAVGPREIIAEMAAQGIELRRLWPPLHRQAPFHGAERLATGDVVADDLFRRGLSLPSSPHLTIEQQDLVCDVLEGVLENTRAVAVSAGEGSA